MHLDDKRMQLLSLAAAIDQQSEFRLQDLGFGLLTTH
jgi:hypothetical protein